MVRLQREGREQARGEGGSTSSGSVQGRRKRSGLAQVRRGVEEEWRRGEGWIIELIEKIDELRLY